MLIQLKLAALVILDITLFHLLGINFCFVLLLLLLLSSSSSSSSSSSLLLLLLGSYFRYIYFLPLGSVGTLNIYIVSRLGELKGNL